MKRSECEERQECFVFFNDLVSQKILYKAHTVRRKYFSGALSNVFIFAEISVKQATVRA